MRSIPVATKGNRQIDRRQVLPGKLPPKMKRKPIYKQI